MRILLYKGKPVEEVCYVSGEKVVTLRYLKDEDKSHCECGRIIDKDINIVEGCRIWNENVRGVDTLPNNEI